MSGTRKRRPVLIAGGGIAGLCLGLALERRGIASRILERRTEPAEAGAGIQLGPNAVGVLSRLGVTGLLEANVGTPEAIQVSVGATGRQLTRLPLGDWIAKRHGAPYWVAHRADLQEALLEALRPARCCEIVRGFEVAGWQEAADSLVVTAVDGREVAGDMLVGADGIWSAVRRGLFPDHARTYSGKMAARTVIPIPLSGSRFAEPMTGVWLAADAHVVHYPVQANRAVAVVVVVDEPAAREGWGGEISAVSVEARLVSFSTELLEFLGRAREWRAWSLFDPTPLPAWSRGRVGLIGDASHPIVPFLAQGGAMAMEDAETLAGLIEAHGDAPAEAFARLERLRMPRVQRVQSASRENGRVFHLRGVERIARDAVLGVAPGGIMMRRYDWLYGWKGDGL